ncbi:hypothetical protein L1887_39621 [Cichorium endivia]|nr:hypothetical protein L1887_39621 [Cichorium endivia]
MTTQSSNWKLAGFMNLEISGNLRKIKTVGGGRYSTLATLKGIKTNSKISRIEAYKPQQIQNPNQKINKAAMTTQSSIWIYVPIFVCSFLTNIPNCEYSIINLETSPELRDPRKLMREIRVHDIFFQTLESPKKRGKGTRSSQIHSLHIRSYSFHPNVS